MLKDAVGFLAVIITFRQVGGAMSKAATQLAEAIRRAIKTMLRSKMERAREQMELMAKERLLKENNAFDDDFEASLGPYLDGKDVRETQDVTAADIFALLKETRDAEQLNAGKEIAEQDEISRADFRRLFAALDLDISDGQFDRLFAVIDLSGSDTITLWEFESAWELLQQEIIEEHVCT